MFTGTQKENRMALAAHLRDNITDADYNHMGLYTPRCCALGHAIREWEEDRGSERGVGSLDGDAVFGPIYSRVFCSDLRFTRKEVIDALEAI